MQVTSTLPFIPLRDTVLLPNETVSIFAGRPMSVSAVHEAQKKDKRIVVSMQKDGSARTPAGEHVCDVGTIAEILDVTPLEGDIIKVKVKGISRVQTARIVDDANCMKAQFLEPASATSAPVGAGTVSKISSEPTESSDLAGIVDAIAAELDLGVRDKQELLETIEIPARLNRILAHIQARRSK